VKDQGVACGGFGRIGEWAGALALCAALAGAGPAAAQGKSVLVIAAHPDDEVLLAAGRTRLSVLGGDRIKVVVVTNGDSGGTAAGLAREGQSVTSAGVLGLTEQDVVFMGFPDGSMRTIHDAASDTTLVTSAAGQTATYGNRGMGGEPYHQLLWGVPGRYDRATVRSDFQNLIAEFQPDEIYTHSDFEDHPDHQAVALFVAEALGALQRSGMGLRTRLYQGIVWMPGGGYPWPELDASAWSPRAPYLPDSSPCGPGLCLDQTVVEWSRAVHFAQPAEMTDSNLGANLKAIALAPLNTIWFDAFVRRDEVFWLKDYGLDLATTAAVTASSEDAAAGLYARNAVDGIVKGYPSEQGFEWASDGELAGAWIQLTWPAPVRIGQVNLWDRPGGDDVLAGTLLFSDGSQVSVGRLPAGGRVMPVLLAPRTVTWVRFRVDQGVGTEVGLSELQVFGAPASSTADVPPNIVQGPAPAARALSAAQTTTVSVIANDVDGDPLTYQWSAEAGTFSGSGATVTYRPPAVSAPTWFAIGVTVSDGRGGTAVNTTYVQVTPAPVLGLAVSPSVILGGRQATGTVTLPAAAPAGGTVVPLASSDPTVAAVPATVTVAAGATTATFAVSTAAVAQARTVTLSATSGTTATASLTVSPLALSGLSLSPITVVGGGAVQGTVTLDGPAPSGGLAVALASSAPAVAAAPATVTVAAGAQSATFTVSTTPVGVVTAATLTATALGSAASAALSVTPPVTNPNLLTSPEQIGGAGWDVWGSLTATLNAAAAPDGTTHATRAVSGGTGHALRQLVGGITPGATYTFSFFARNDGGAAASYSVYDDTHGADIVAPTSYLSGLGPVGFTRVSVTFTVPAGCTGVGVYALRDSGGPVNVLLWGARLELGSQATGYQNLGTEALAVSPGTVTGGGTAVGTVTLASPAPAGGITVALSATGPAAVPASVAVPAGATGATFPVSAGAVAASTTATLSAALPGGTRTASLVVTPPAVTRLAVSPAAVVGGVDPTATVTLSGPAPAGGAVVALASSATSIAAVPAAVTVPAGATSASFTVTTSGAAATTAVTLSATYGATATATLTVGPLALSGLSLSPGVVVGGETSQGTVTLSGPAPAGGAAVALTSSAPSTAAVPASVTVPAGATSATFTVGTVSVVTSTAVTVGAAFGGATATASLTVNAYVPPPPNPNLLLSPTQLGGPGWDVWGNLTVALNAGMAPDGSATASRATSNGAGHALRQLALGLTAGTTYTFSFYAQNDGGTAASYSVYDDDHGQDIVPATSYVSQLGGTGFTRVIVTFVTPPGCRAVGLYPLRDSGGPVDVMVWGAKLEVGPVATGL
jgi:LmbE family N-acetylglucosaminyl deacetylase